MVKQKELECDKYALELLPREEKGDSMVIKDFTKPEIDFFLSVCNFTDIEKEFFLHRTAGHTLDETAEMMNISRRTADTYSKKVKNKILKVI